MSRLSWLLCALSVCSACSEDRGPITPSLPLPPSVYVLSGTVYEHSQSGARPLARVPLATESADSLGTTNTVPFYTTNDDGQYRIEFEGWRGPGLRIVRAVASGYRQPCRAATTLKDGENILDVHLVPESVLSTSGIPSSLPVVEPFVSGLVFERTTQGDLPVKGALVNGEFGWDFRDEVIVGATTLTDASGRYLLCGVESATGVSVVANGYAFATVTVNLARTRSYDFALVRK